MKHFLKSQFQRGFPGFLMAVMWALFLTACGGGGGSAGTNPNNPTPDPTTQPSSKAASIVITTSSDSMPTTGGLVTVTVLVKDANNNVVPDAIISLKTDSGVLSRDNVDRKTDKNGLVIENLTSPGDSSARTITITASVGSVAPVTKTVKVDPTIPLSKAASISITTSSDSMPTSGGAVVVYVLVKDVNNNVVPDAVISLKTDSGVLSLDNVARKTDKNGLVIETLTSPGDSSARTITLTASVGTVTPATKTVKVDAALPVSKVASLVITTSRDSMPTSGGLVTVTVLAKDSNNNAVPDAILSLKADSGLLSRDNVERKTDKNGLVIETLTSPGDSSPRTITITATSGNATPATKTVRVDASLPLPKAASVVITSVSPSLLTTGGSTAISALVKDANNNVLPDVVINLKTDTGSISLNNTTRKSDKDGLLTETLTILDGSPVGTITITASVEGLAPVTKTIPILAPVKPVPTLQLTASSGVLDSTGAAGSEVTITATVRDAGNNVLKDVPVTLTADSGSLSVGARVTDAKGIVSETLGTASDPTARTILVTASTPGAVSKVLSIQVAGHKVQITSNESANLGKVSKVTAVLLDSSNKPMVNALMSFSASRSPNGLSVTGTGVKGSTRTDAQGQIQLDFVPSSGPSDTITVSALGVSASKLITVNTLNFTVTAFNSSNTATTSASINQCVKFTAHVDRAGVPVTGLVSLNSSRGAVFSDSVCLTPLSSARSLDSSGNTTGYVRATTPGVAALVATYEDTTPASATSELEFVAPLVSTARISLQADPSVVGVGKPTTLKAVVRDGTALDNLVKNAYVVFSIVEDPSGGRLAQPSVVKTDSDGAATVVYTGGATTTAVGGVKLKAQIQDPIATGAGNNAIATVTVGGQSLFISAGTGNTIGTPDTSSYSADYVVLVTDAAGNAVSNATVTVKVRPREYLKGRFVFSSTVNRWVFAAPIYTCLNEDVNGNGVLDNEDRNANGVLDAGEDLDGDGVLDKEDSNNSGRLEPGIPINVTGSKTTNANGVATITLVYPKDRAYWTTADITITARVVGTEATYITYTGLSGLTSDYNKADTSPPGEVSPYGTNVCGTAG